MELSMVVGGRVRHGFSHGGLVLDPGDWSRPPLQKLGMGGKRTTSTKLVFTDCYCNVVIHHTASHHLQSFVSLPNSDCTFDLRDK